MKVHFAALVDGNRSNYFKIIDSIKKQEHELITEHYLNRTVEEIENESFNESKKFHSEFINWMKKADVIIYEITKNDINAGYELSFAMAMKKPVILLYEKNKTSTPFVLRGIDNDLLQVIEYNISDIDYIISEALELAKNQLDIRFNLFISSKQNNFLEDQAQKRKISKSIIIRDLIEKEMRAVLA